ncbi:hypothetical protein [Syntrophorhabdus aromaticivorans]|nr:hypothetical protein [Syntrophorhabdus aromaticivorans]
MRIERVFAPASELEPKLTFRALAANFLYNPNGHTGDDTLIGDANNNVLAGGPGSDTFNAGAGDDVLLVDAEDLQENIHAGDGLDHRHPDQTNIDPAWLADHGYHQKCSITRGALSNE